MSDDDADDRSMGIELGEFEDDLESMDYPVSKSELLDEYGDREFQLMNERTTLGAILGDMNIDQFDSYRHLQDSLVGNVGQDAVGRQGYSDRGGETPEEAAAGSEAESGTEDAYTGSEDDEGSEDENGNGSEGGDDGR